MAGASAGCTAAGGATSAGRGATTGSAGTSSSDGHRRCSADQTRDRFRRGGVNVGRGVVGPAGQGAEPERKSTRSGAEPDRRRGEHRDREQECPGRAACKQPTPPLLSQRVMQGFL